MEGTRPLRVQPYPTTYAVRMFKINVKISAVFDFNILTAFIRLGRARPVRGGVPSILLFIGLVPSNPAPPTYHPSIRHLQAQDVIDGESGQP